jgi:hypothetical protein
MGSHALGTRIIALATGLVMRQLAVAKGPGAELTSEMLDFTTLLPDDYLEVIEMRVSAG